jgi:hypothetical protein
VTLHGFVSATPELIVSIVSVWRFADDADDQLRTLYPENAFSGMALAVKGDGYAHASQWRLHAANG